MSDARLKSRDLYLTTEDGVKVEGEDTSSQGPHQRQLRQLYVVLLSFVKHSAHEAPARSTYKAQEVFDLGFSATALEVKSVQWRHIVFIQITEKFSVTSPNKRHLVCLW
jgi:hypothetical protein